jgi:hypothetical protein
MVGVQTFYNNSRFLKVLGVTPTNFSLTLIDTAYSLIEKKIVPKKW